MSGVESAAWPWPWAVSSMNVWQLWRLRIQRMARALKLWRVKIQRMATELKRSVSVEERGLAARVICPLATVRILAAKILKRTGVITFVSQAWGGRTTDKFITEQCGLLKSFSQETKCLLTMVLLCKRVSAWIVPSWRFHHLLGQAAAFTSWSWQGQAAL